MAHYPPLGTLNNESGYVSIFGTKDGNLWERFFAPGQPDWQWKCHGKPPEENSYASSASIVGVTGSSNYMGVFLIDNNARLWECYPPQGDWNQTWNWHKHPYEDPGGTPGIFDEGMSAISDLESGYIGVFGVLVGGGLLERYWRPDTAKWEWYMHEGPPVAPCCAVAAPWGYKGVFVVDYDNHRLRELYFDHGWNWAPADTHDGAHHAVSSALGLAAVASPEYVGVFDVHWERYFLKGQDWAWRPHNMVFSEYGGPSAIWHAPTNYIGVWGLGQGPDGHMGELCELASSDQGRTWERFYHGKQLVQGYGKPAPISSAVRGYLGIFLLSNDNRWIEYYFIPGVRWKSRDHGVPGSAFDSGAPQTNTN